MIRYPISGNAPTVAEALNQVLGRTEPGQSTLAIREASANLETSLAASLLLYRGKLGSFDFVRQFAAGSVLFVGDGNRRVPIYGRNPNHNLARRFLRSAAGQLDRGGHVIVTLVDTPYYQGAFDLTRAARLAGLQSPDIYRFHPTKFPAYSHTNTIGDGSALERYRKFTAWIFKR